MEGVRFCPPADIFHVEGDDRSDFVRRQTFFPCGGGWRADMFCPLADKLVMISQLTHLFEISSPSEPFAMGMLCPPADKFPRASQVVFFSQKSHFLPHA